MSISYNLEDRKEYILETIKDKIKFKLNIDIKDIQKKVDNENVLEYNIEIKDTSELKEFTDFLKELGFKLEKNKWVINVN